MLYTDQYLADQRLINTAFYLARKGHGSQTRRDGITPYLFHIEAVCDRAPQDAVSQAVAAMHDLGEDAAWITYEEMAKEGIPPEVISGVRALTKLPGEDYPSFIARIKATDGGRWVPIKVADILANLSDSPTDKQILKYAKALVVLMSPTPASLIVT